MREHFCVCVQVAEASAADPRLGRSGEIWHRWRICQARRTRRGEVGRSRISQLECGHALGQGNLEMPYARQFELRLCGVAGQLDCDPILGVARDLTGGLFDLVLERCA